MKKEYSNCFRLQNTLIERIVLGQYRSGESLPSSSELAKEFSVSAATVKRALDNVAASSLIRRRNGRSPVVMEMPGANLHGHTGVRRVAIVRDVMTDGFYFPFECGPWTWTLQELLYARFMHDHIPVITLGKKDIPAQTALLRTMSGVLYVTAQSIPDPEVAIQLDTLGIIHVTLDGQCDKQSEYDMVCYDFSSANEKVAIYLLSHGVNAIDVIASPVADHRLDSFFELLRDQRFPENKLSLIQLQHFTESALLEQRYKQQFAALPHPLGIVCYSDVSAATVLTLLRQMGWTAKKDFFLVSLGGRLLAPQADLSCCTLELEQLAQQAVDCLYRRCAGGAPEKTIRIKLDLMIGNT